MILYALPVFWVLRPEFNENKDELEVVVFSLKQKQKTKNKSHWFLELVSHKSSKLSDQ